jgi:CheY-like chemotaxis protein
LLLLITASHAAPSASSAAAIPLRIVIPPYVGLRVIETRADAAVLEVVCSMRGYRLGMDIVDPAVVAVDVDGFDQPVRVVPGGVEIQIPVHAADERRSRRSLRYRVHSPQAPLPRAASRRSPSRSRACSLVVGGLTPMAVTAPALRHILQIDDDEDILAIGKLALESYGGYEVRSRERRGGPRGARAPQLIVLDWMMPGMDGLAFLHALRMLHGGDAICVVCITASVANERRDRLLKAGAVGIIPKPFDTHVVRPGCGSLEQPLAGSGLRLLKHGAAPRMRVGRSW